MRQSFNIFGIISVYFYGIFIAIGCLVGYLIARKRLAKFELKENDLETILVFLIPFSVVGARVYHLLSWYSYYYLFPQEIFSLRQGGLGIYGAVIFGFLTLVFVCKRIKVNPLKYLDLLSLPILLCQAIGRLGNYFNQEAFGPPTNLAWKFFVPSDKRPINFLNDSYFHPTFLYESILCLLASLLLLYLEKKRKVLPGFSFGFYLLLYGSIRFFTEFLRFDTWQIQGIKVAQAISVLFVVIGIYLIRNGIKDKKLIES